MSDELERFWSKVDKHGPNGCWVWTAGTFSSGYGSFWLKGRMRHAHRVAWHWMRGPVPEGMTLDHLCRNRACVNPDHLEPVTHQVNILRGVGASAQHARKTHCPQGHAYDEANTEWYGNRRRCITCRREHQRRAYREKVGT